jgi:C4-dicarboxylate-specific signal transduction histidine kinase
MDRFREETRQTAHFALMGEMAAAMAHELSHPLGAIVANAQAARRMLDHPRHGSRTRGLYADHFRFAQ